MAGTDLELLLNTMQQAQELETNLAISYLFTEGLYTATLSRINKELYDFTDAPFPRDHDPNLWSHHPLKSELFHYAPGPRLGRSAGRGRFAS